MNLLLYLSLGLAGVLYPAALQDSAPSYQQSYSIFIRGELAGTEMVAERTDEEGDTVAGSRHELLFSDGLQTKQMNFETTTVMPKEGLLPKSYHFKYTSGNSDYYDVEVRNGRIFRVLNRNGQSAEASIEVEPRMVLLDVNVYHLYDYLSRAYDFKLGGRQIFKDFIPVIANHIELALTLMEDSEVETAAGGKLPVHRFKIDFVGVRSGTFLTDMEGRLVRLSMPSQDLEVLRNDIKQ